MKNKILFWILVTFTLLNIIDIVTTIFIIKGEANPLYHLFGTIWVVYILKFLIVVVLWWLYKINTYSSKMLYFGMLTIVVYGSFALLLAQVINIYGIIHPVLLEQAATVSTTVKVKQYFQITSLIYFIPVMFTLGIFWLYDKSFNSININKEYNQIKGWWKFW